MPFLFPSNFRKRLLNDSQQFLLLALGKVVVYHQFFNIWSIKYSTIIWFWYRKFWKQLYQILKIFYETRVRTRKNGHRFMFLSRNCLQNWWNFGIFKTLLTCSECLPFIFVWSTNLSNFVNLRLLFNSILTFWLFIYLLIYCEVIDSHFVLVHSSTVLSFLFYSKILIIVLIFADAKDCRLNFYSEVFA